MIHNQRHNLILFIFLLFLNGCATLTEVTLPAAKEKTYNFPAYSVTPLEDNPEWRFWRKDKDLERLTFIHAKFESYLFFSVTPLFKESSVEKTEKGIIDYFQNKTLKEFKLSPDIKLSDQSIQRFEQKIGDRAYQVVTIAYEFEKTSYELAIYYYVSVQDGLLYEASILKNKTKPKESGWEDSLMRDFYEIVKNVSFKKPKPQEIIELRVNFAFSNFFESTKDKYLKEKTNEIKEKYQFASEEVQKWLVLKKDNYIGYNLLGFLLTYNDKFEQYGEGFNFPEAEKYFLKSSHIRPYYKDAHVNLAELYKTMNKVDQALKEYDTALKISPNDDDLYYKVGQVYENKADLKTAKVYYEKAIKHWGSGFTTLEELKNKIKKWN